jgi:flagella basal body P-ring formation protein FlgA
MKIRITKKTQRHPEARRALLTVLFILAIAPCALADCLPVTGDHILGRDLALADPRFSAMPASYIVSSSPLPGARRVFAAAEITRIAHANNIHLDEASELCFVVPVKPVADEEMIAAMQRSLPRGVDIAIVDRSRAETPTGEIVFSPAGLSPASASDPTVQLWRGFVRYSETRRVEIWALVNVRGQYTTVVAAGELARNVPIDAASVRMETWTGPLQREAVAVRIEDVLGRIPTRTLKAGAPIPLSFLTQPPAVRRGEAVTVDVQCGPARLRLNAIAERDGRNGEMLELRNPTSGKTFRARLEGSKAVLIIPAEQTL